MPTNNRTQYHKEKNVRLSKTVRIAGCSVAPKSQLKLSTADNQNHEQPLAQRESKDIDVAELLKDQPVYMNSIGAALLGLDHGSVLRELQKARHDMLRFYMSEQGGDHSIEEAIKLVDDFPESAEATLKTVLSASVHTISWYGLEKLYNHSPQLVKQIWRLICDEAKQEMMNGHRMASNFQVTDWQRDP